MYAELDKQTKELIVTLPVELEQYFNELNNILMDEFGFDLMNKHTLERINMFIVKWFAEKGIELKEPPQEEEVPGSKQNNTKESLFPDSK
ncbi:MAG: hypothetical protein GY754_20420 [bacterium]|nr:hypothetical protein [bacterium]